MSNKELLETELEVQYELIQQGKDVVIAIDDAVYAATNERLSGMEKDVFIHYPNGLREFIDWCIDRIVEFIEWIKDWFNEED